jgi:hypothetical protein
MFAIRRHGGARRPVARQESSPRRPAAVIIFFTSSAGIADPYYPGERSGGFSVGVIPSKDETPVESSTNLLGSGEEKSVFR